MVLLQENADWLQTAEVCRAARSACKTFLQMSTTGMTFLLLAIGEGAADITTSTHWLNVYCAIAFWIVSVITVLSGLIYAKDGWYLIKTK